MKAKTKKLLKKGLHLAGAIGLSTLVLGGSFLLGFEVGKATYQPKEDKSLSPAKPKEALHPKRTIYTELNAPTTYMQSLVGRKDLYIKANETNDIERFNQEHVDYSITWIWDCKGKVGNDYLTQVAFDEITISYYQEYDPTKPNVPENWEYSIYTNAQGVEADAGNILWIDEAGSWYLDEWDNNYGENYTPTTPDDILQRLLGFVTEQPYIEVDGNTFWTALASNQPYGMSLARVSSTLEINPPLQAQNIPFKWGVQIDGVYFPVLYFEADWTEVKGNTAIAGFGSTFRTAQDGEYQALPFIKMAVSQGYSQVFAYNDWALPGVGSITTDGFTDFWKYGNGKSTAKIYVWGSMLDSWNVYPNGQMGYKNNAEYLASGNGTWKNWTPNLDWNKNEPNAQNVFTLIGGALSGVAGLFAISVLPGITLGTLLLVPFVVTMVVVLIKILRK